MFPEFIAAEARAAGKSDKGLSASAIAKGLPLTQLRKAFTAIMQLDSSNEEEMNKLEDLIEKLDNK